ncbi:hypothetical protein EMIHUDRAFT_205370 [Emiliania huxleyi CCMP1516]|uniref:Uncharacterized protein n=2 Tax=Emiliania huxleyi TaxID=2903 RepID=A0A0D3JS83_EMIH1|nr:hypothetical protein EMIHUDRAFT_205370 [Emiliania huxleyi CCMP1516]EOD26368.1 hypothetical protein EMIHUDRAFT_205370 [Emiliania huxleyi CCMP1516]|eukprot:XP_005778797.1 hypothetical protein EMIHUDRAFT_205370 [Emiliania huxleyi CCMP1516]
MREAGMWSCPQRRTPAKARMIVLFYDRAARMLQPISDAASRAADWQLEEWRLGWRCCGTTVSSFGCVWIFCD